MSKADEEGADEEGADEEGADEEGAMAPRPDLEGRDEGRCGLPRRMRKPPVTDEEGMFQSSSVRKEPFV